MRVCTLDGKLWRPGSPADEAMPARHSALGDRISLAPACRSCPAAAGQERREVPGAAHTACTVEMVNMQRRVDVAVIDEIQMIGDESRWARCLEGTYLPLLV